MRPDQEVEAALQALQEQRKYAAGQVTAEKNIMTVMFAGMVEELDVMIDVLETRMTFARCYELYGRNLKSYQFFAASLAVEFLHGEIKFEKLKKSL